MDALNQLIATTLNIPVDEVTDDIGFGKHPAWDSVGQINLVMAVEERFGIMIGDDILASLTDPSRLRAHLEQVGVLP